MRRFMNHSTSPFKYMTRLSAGVAGAVLMLSSMGCPHATTGDPNSPDNGQTDPNQGGTTDPNTGGTTDPNSGTTDPNAAGGTLITNVADSISTVAGGTRTDPEGVAAAESVTNITWKDSRGASRTMALGSYLHQYDFSFNDNQNVVTRTANDDAYGHEGFGYVVSHADNGNSPIGKANVPTLVQTTVFKGGQHAVHHIEMLYDRDKEGGGFGIKIPIVIEWMVATGRDHPVWAITWKMGSATNPTNQDFSGAYTMDVRAPYGSLNFDGAATRNDGDAIGGVAWGDYLYRFETSGAELNLNSPWTYNAPNFVNFSRTWTETVNAEMGIVQTRGGDASFPRGDRVAGSERGHTSADAYPHKGDCTAYADARNYVVPCIDAWPYQLMNYDWETPGKPANEGTSTKIVAWGSPYGWLGSANFKSFDGGQTLDGRGDRAYSTFIVLGPKQRYNSASGMWDLPGDVMTVVDQVKAYSLAQLTDVNPGSVATQAPKGPGASENKTLLNGYNDTFAAYYLNAADNHVKFSFTPDLSSPIDRPIFVIENYTDRQIPTVLVNGAAVTVNTGDNDSGAFVSINEAGNELWVTLNRNITAAAQIEIVAP